MENLFYSPSEKILFYIAGYTDDSRNVKDIISMYQNNYNFFYNICGIKTINTYFVYKSTRYQNMRVFFCTTENPPTDAFNLSMNEQRKDQVEWTMIKWLTY